jgi:hypothetical protein
MNFPTSNERLNELMGKFEAASTDGEIALTSDDIGDTYSWFLWIAESQAWISVQETLPEEGRQVLVWMVDDNSKIGGDYEADVQLWEYNKGHPFFPRRKNARSGVTHWMPLPNPPKGNENV